MKVFLLFMGILMSYASVAQEQGITSNSYKFLKLDLLDAMGIGIRHIDIGYEQSLFKQKESRVTTLQVNLRTPLHNSDIMKVDWGTEAHVQLRFYPVKGNKNPLIDGWFYGVGFMGGYTAYSQEFEYVNNVNWQLRRVYTFDYDRTVLGAYGVVGSQTQLTDKVYFEMSLGFGLTSINVNESAPEIAPDYQRDDWWWTPVLYTSYEEGSYAFPTVPINIAIAYNFGDK